jgi:hypothetical protein
MAHEVRMNIYFELPHLRLISSLSAIRRSGLRGLDNLGDYQRYSISKSKLASSVVKGVVPETTRVAESLLFMLKDRLP